MNQPNKERFKTSVGGQALMEGIMMRGPKKICCAVRKPDGTRPSWKIPLPTASGQKFLSCGVPSRWSRASSWATAT